MAPFVTWERVAHYSHFYALPAAGGAALALASLTLLGLRNEFERYLPFVLAVVGLAALVGSCASYACVLPSRSTEPRSVSGRRAASSEPKPPQSPRPSGIGESPRPSGAPTRAARRAG